MDESTHWVTFVTQTLKGERFAGHSVPVTVLPELAAYRDLIVQVARALFFRDNPDRQRVPRGFEESFDLVLRGIDEGSAVAPLERRVKTPAVAAGQLSFLPGAQAAPPTDYFDRARDLVNELIGAMQGGQAPPVAFPVEVAPSFNKFGRSLQADEAIELSGPNGRLSATYDRAVRKKLVLLRDATYEDRVEVVGRVVQYDTQRRTFGLVHEHRTVIGSLEGLDEEKQRVVRAAAVHTEDLRVRATGTGAFDADDRLVRLVSIEDLSFAEDEELRERLNVQARLTALAELAEGWLDGHGASLEPAALSWVASVLTQGESEGLSRPYLYPTPEGHVQAEWSFPGFEVSVVFDFPRKVLSCVGVHLKSGAVGDEDIELDSTGGIGRLVRFVGGFAP